MADKIIVTIARQYGSGGRLVGKKLAEILNASFYDNQLITLAAKESGINEDLFESVDEQTGSSFWSSMALNANVFGNRVTPLNDMPLNDRLFVIQSNIIKKVSKEGSCVIVGRCADYILENDPNAVHVFIHCNEQDKIKRIIEDYNIGENEARNVMIKTDRKRQSYYNYYADGKWGRSDNYDLAIESSLLGIDRTAELIADFAKETIARRKNAD